MRKSKKQRVSISDRAINSILVRKLIYWAKSHSLPGLQGVPVYDITIFIYNETMRDNIVTRANSIAYSIFVSIFPTILALFTLIPMILPYFETVILSSIPENIHVLSGDHIDLNQTIVNQMNLIFDKIAILPDQVIEQLFDFIENVLFRPRFGLFSVGFLFAMYFSSNGMMNMMEGFEKAHSQKFYQRSWIKKRLLSLGLISIVIVLVILSVVFIVFGNSILEWLFDRVHLENSITNTIINTMRWLILLTCFYLGIGIIYRLGTAIRPRMKIFMPGTTLATSLTIISSLGLTFFVNSPYSKYDELYGSIGTIMVILLWIQINAFILLLGFELNASILVHRDIKEKIEE